MGNLVENSLLKDLRIIEISVKIVQNENEIEIPNSILRKIEILMK